MAKKDHTDLRIIKPEQLEKAELHAEVRHIQQEIIGLALISGAAVTFVGYFFPNLTGFVGKVLMDQIIKQFFGQGALILPLLLSGLGMIFLTRKNELALSVRLPGYLIAFLTLVTLLEINHTGTLTSFLWPVPGTGGGIVGYCLSFGIQKIIGIAGAFMFLTTALVIALLLSFNLTVAKIFEMLATWRTSRREVRENAELSALTHGDAGIEPAHHTLQTIARVWIMIKDFLFGPEEYELSESLTTDNPTPVSISNSDIEIHHKKDGRLKAITVPTVKVDQDDPDGEFIPFISTANLDEEVKKKERTKKIPVLTGQGIMNKKADTPVQPKTREGEYQLPPLSLLEAPVKKIMDDRGRIQEETRKLEQLFKDFKVDAHVVSISCGPSVTRYELQPGPGVRVAKISGLSNDIALGLAAHGVRIEAPVPGKSVVGIEVPNPKTDIVNLSGIISTTDFYKRKSKLTAALGVSISGEPILADIAKTPHMLIAGATGSGKSVCINSIICSILMKATPDEVKFLMIDPKKVELSIYDNIPHLLAPVVTDPRKAAATLKEWAIQEMERRYEEFSIAGVRNLESYNIKVDELRKDDERRRLLATVRAKDNFLVPEEQKGAYIDSFIPGKLPLIVVMIDELADLMMVASNDVETSICRLAQMARATGIHLIISTQRPSVDVITGLIKANIPTRIAFAVSSQIDSRTIIDTAGAEKLMGHGDMLYSPIGAMKPSRAQGTYISDAETERIIAHVKSQGQPEYLQAILDVEPLPEKGKKGVTANGFSEAEDDEDELFAQAKELVLATQQASTSYLQRKLRIGYNRAARLIDELQEKGVISNYEGENKARRVIGTMEL